MTRGTATPKIQLLGHTRLKDQQFNRHFVSRRIQPQRLARMLRVFKERIFSLHQSSFVQNKLFYKTHTFHECFGSAKLEVRHGG